MNVARQRQPSRPLGSPRDQSATISLNVAKPRTASPIPVQVVRSGVSTVDGRVHRANPQATFGQRSLIFHNSEPAAERGDREHVAKRHPFAGAASTISFPVPICQPRLFPPAPKHKSKY